MNLPPRSHRLCRISLAALALSSASCNVAAAGPLPSGAQVVSGNVRVGPGAGVSLDVVQTSPRAIINWDSFSVGPGSQVRFVQPNLTSATLNRVVGTTPSTIAGTLNANGQVFLVNPNGIAITRGGTVDVGGGFIASTLGVGDQDFLSGHLNFAGSGASARISQDGTIRTQSEGTVVLLGGSVSNSGLVAAPLGKIMVGSGEMATIDLHGDGMLQVALPSASTTKDGAPRIDIGGTLQAKGGRILVGAASVRQAWHDVVNVSGELVARSYSGRDGAIVLEAGPGGVVNVSGQLDASGTHSAGDIRISGAAALVDGPHAAIIASSENGQGGSVTLAPRGELTVGRALFDVSGATGGGSIRLGGDATGAGSLDHAQQSFVGSSAQLRADATRDGSGGRVILWSDARTEFLGEISARGAGAQGSGGFAEVSSHGVLQFAGTADLRGGAPGRAGTLLLDPFDVTISSAASCSCNASFTATGNDSVVNVTTLQNALATANVTVSTGTSGTQAGDITVASPVAWNSGNTLTLAAARDINVNANVTSNGGSLTLNAGRGVIFTGSTISTGGGTLTSTTNATDGTSGVKLDGATIDVGTGTATLNGTSSAGFGVRFLGLASSLSASGAGSITLNGNSIDSHGVVVETAISTSGQVAINGSSSNSYGLALEGSAITSSAGSITLNGNSISSHGAVVETALSTSGQVAINGSSSSSYGLALKGSAITSSAGSITLNGNSISSHGAVVETALSTSGQVAINGSSSSAFGLDFQGTAITSSGNLAFRGTSDTSNAVWVEGNTLSLSSTGSGVLSVQGTSNNFNGIRLNSGAALTTSGTVQLSGTSLNGGGGFSLVGSNTITVNSGNTTINGTAAGSFNAIDMASSGNSVANNGTGTLALAGNGNISLAASVTSATGSLAINATGDLSLNSGTQITWPAGATQTLNAGRDINVNTALSGQGRLQLNAGRDITVASNITASGGPLNVDLTASPSGGSVSIVNATIDTGGGNLTATATQTGPTTGLSLSDATLNVGSGTGTLTGRSDSGAGVFLIGAVQMLTTSGSTGSIKLNGDSASSNGITFNDNASLTTTGSVTLAGTSGTAVGIYMLGSSTLSATSGALALAGTSSSNTGIWLNAGTSALNSAGAATISLAGSSGSFRGIGLNSNVVVTSDGHVSLSGTGSEAGIWFNSSNALIESNGSLAVSGTSSTGAGIWFNGGINSLVQSGADALTINGLSDSSSGLHMNDGAGLSTQGSVSLSGTSTGGPGIFFAGNNALTVIAGTVLLNGTSSSGNGAQLAGNLTMAVNGAGSLALNGLSATGNGIDVVDGSALSTSGGIAMTGTSSSSNGLSFGLSTLTHTAADLTLTASSGTSTSMLLAPGSSIVNTGTGTLHLDAATGITLGASLSSPSGPLWLSAGGEVTQTAGGITAAGLRLSGDGASYLLEAAGNQVQTLTAHTGSVTLHNASDLTIGTVLGSTGSTTTGSITAYSDGDLTIESGAAVNGANPVLAAVGNFINRSGAAAVSATSGRWLVYAANPAGSTFGGLDSGNTALWNASYASHPPGSVTAMGNRYLFALQPALTVASTNASKVYGDDASAVIAGNYTITGLQSGVANAFLGDTTSSAYGGSPSVTSAGSSATAGVASSPYAVVASPGSLSSPAGYEFVFANTGQLSVTSRPLFFVAQPTTRLYGQANPVLQGTMVGLVNGDTLGSVAGGTPVWTTTASPLSLPGTYAVDGGGLAPLGSNYVLMQDPSNMSALTITPRVAESFPPPSAGGGASVAFAGNSQAYCVLGPMLTRSEQTRCKLDSDTVRMPVLQEQEAELP